MILATWSIADPSTWVWSDPNQMLATTSAATVALVAVGGWIAYRQLRHARDGRAEEQRPFVVVDVFGSRANVFRIEVMNLGKTIARNVNIVFDPPLTSTHDSATQKIQNIPMLAKGLPSLAPGKRHTFLLDSAHKRTRDTYPDTYAVTVTYVGYDGREYTDEQVVDLGVYWNTPDLRERDIHDVWHSLEKTNKSLHGIHEALLNMIPQPENKHWPPLPKSAQYPDVIEGMPRSIEGTGFPRTPDVAHGAEESREDDSD